MNDLYSYIIAAEMSGGYQITEDVGWFMHRTLEAGLTAKSGVMPPKGGSLGCPGGP